MFRFSGALSALAVLAASMAFVAPASAQIIDGASPEGIMELMQDKGFDVEFADIDDAPGPVLSSYTNDLRFLVSFDACDEDGEECELIVFRCGFSMEPDEQPSLEMLNAWNDSNWGKARADDVGDPWIVLEVNTVGGITEDNLSDTLDWWETLVSEFVDYIGYGDDEG